MKKNTIYLTCISLLLISCGQSQKNKEDQGPTAFEISNIDSSLHPCDNFYKYAIGNWQKNNPVPETESRWMAFDILGKANKEKLLTIVHEISKNKDLERGTDKQLIRDLYRSALDSSNLEKTGLESLQAYFEHVDNIKSKEDLYTSFAKLAPLGIRTPFNFSVGRDKMNSDKYVVTLSQGGLSLPDRDYYLRKDEKHKAIRSAFRVYARNMFNEAGFVEDQPGSRILELEKSIARICWARSEMRDPYKTYNKNSISGWNEQLSSIPLATLLQQHGMSSADSLIIGQPSFIEGLDALLNSVDLTEWKLYLKWKLLNGYAPYLGDEFEKANFAFYSTTLRGTKEMKPRDERILSVMNSTLGEPLGKFYVEKHFSKDAKEYMKTMIENLREAYRVRIQSLTWMSSATKEKAMKKLDAFTYKVGYPDKWKNHSSIDIDPENYTQNIMNIRSWKFNDMVNKLGKPVDKDEWFMVPQMVNAYYNSSGNEIVFPAGILQPPFFHPSFDHAINYGGIGAVIGHEFTHGFDDQGSKYDWNGNLNNWWTEEDRIAFDALGKDLVRQYSAYSPLDTLHVNGTLTLGENIADLGGVTLAYHALENAYQGKYPKPIDGYSWQQRFFLGWANVWKGNITEEELRNRLITDPHSPAEYRGNGPLVNFDPFYKAFGPCIGKSMFKSDSTRIRIW